MAGERQIWNRAQGLVLMLALAWGGPAAAQILGGGGPGVPGALGLPSGLRDAPRITPDLAAPRLPRARLSELGDTAGGLVSAPLTDLRRLMAERLLREHRD